MRSNLFLYRGFIQYESYNTTQSGFYKILKNIRKLCSLLYCIAIMVIKNNFFLTLTIFYLESVIISTLIVSHE